MISFLVFGLLRGGVVVGLGYVVVGFGFCGWFVGWIAVLWLGLLCCLFVFVNLFYCDFVIECLV